MQMATVTLKNVKKIYDNKVTAVHDFNLDIADKEFIVLVGPSGCGKSTTLRMIAGLEDISEGDLLWEIKRRGPLSLHAMEDISIMNVPRGHNYKAIHVNSKMENLIHRAMNQNFVPVVDDGNYFIGIVTRKDIIGYCYKQLSDCYLKEGCPKKH